MSTITTGSNVRSFSYLASGQVSQDVRDPSHTYTFAANDNGRNASASLNGSTVGSYLTNAFEQRVQKVAGGVTTRFVFDRFGHLLEEADASGIVQREYIWLDDLPVAMVDDTGLAPVIYYIHTDQLGTPQKITDQAARLVWDGQFDPFGNIIPISITPIPGGTNWGTGVWNSFNWDLPPLVAVPTNLRFPGQYADAETGLSQNWNRDYDPTMGRYVQSDPIGLVGGVNTYGYVGANPLRLSDASGLAHKFDPDSPFCLRQKQRIKNIEDEIAKRKSELASNPRGLPYLPPYPGAPRKLHVQGHEELLQDAESRLENAKRVYKERCGCDDNEGGGSPAPVPSPSLPPLAPAATPEILTLIEELLAGALAL